MVRDSNPLQLLQMLTLRMARADVLYLVSARHAPPEQFSRYARITFCKRSYVILRTEVTDERKNQTLACSHNCSRWRAR